MWRHEALESLGAHESCFYSRMHQCIYSPVSAASRLTKAVERVAITVVQISKLRYKCAYFGSHRTVSGALIKQPTSSASPQTLHVQEYFSYIRLTLKGGMTNSSAALFQHLQLMLQPTVKEASAMPFPPSLHLIFLNACFTHAPPDWTLWNTSKSATPYGCQICMKDERLLIYAFQRAVDMRVSVRQWQCLQWQRVIHNGTQNQKADNSVRRAT